MTLKEAYEKARVLRKIDGLPKLWGCYDWGEFWNFIFVPEDYNGGPFSGGTIMINKKTGETGIFTPQKRIGLLNKGGKGVEIPISQVLATAVPRQPAKPVSPSVQSRPKLAYA